MEIKDRIKEFRRVKAKDLKPHPLNWRVHNSDQKAALKGLLDEIGFAGALLVRPVADGKFEILDGHLRAKTLGSMEVPVVVADLNDEEARKVLLTFDPLSTMAESDGDRIKRLLENVHTNSPAIGALLDRVSGAANWDGLTRAREVTEDAIPAQPVNPVARNGQIWLLGKHRLLCGDSTNPEHVGRLMGDERAILFQTDPPYAVGYSGGSHPATRANRGKANRDKDWSKVYHEVGATTFENEDGGGDGGRTFYLAFCKAAVNCAIDPLAAWYCWHASKRQAMLESVWNELGAFVHQQIIWSKSRPVLTYSVYMWAHEPCLFGWLRGNRPLVERKAEGGYPSTVWEIPNAEIESKDHPTTKPNRLFAIPMELHTKPGELCYEPFSGSGSQLIAAEQLGRRCYAIEIEPGFVDVAVQRWEKITGKKADVAQVE